MFITHLKIKISIQAYEIILGTFWLSRLLADAATTTDPILLSRLHIHVDDRHLQSQSPSLALLILVVFS